MAPRPYSWWKETLSVPWKIVTGAGVVFGAIAGGLALLFQFEPSWQPCVAGSSASFSSAKVFPNVAFRQYLATNGLDPQEIKNVSDSDARGAEVRFLYSADSLRGKHLVLYATLVRVDKAGSAIGVDQYLDEFREYAIVPHACSESGGYDVFVKPIPAGSRYSIVLELYRGERIKSGKKHLFEPRLALIETAPFEG